MSRDAAYSLLLPWVSLSQRASISTISGTTVVGFFTRPDVKYFLEAVNHTGYILSHRWGDSTIQAYAVRLFMLSAELLQVPNFAYVHGSHGNSFVSTFGDSFVSTFGDGSDTNVPQRLPIGTNAEHRETIEPVSTRHSSISRSQ